MDPKLSIIKSSSLSISVKTQSVSNQKDSYK